MTSSVLTFRRLLGPFEHLVVSLNGATGRMVEGTCTDVGIPSPKPRLALPGIGTLTAWRWSSRVLAEVDSFRPDALLIRTAHYWTCSRLLSRAIRQNIPTLVLFANTLPDRASLGVLQRFLRHRLVGQLNHPVVHWVGNHRSVAAASCVAAGVAAGKVVSYDWPGAADPSAYDPKQPPDTSSRIRIVYAGVISADKGIHDFAAAMERLQVCGASLDVQVFGSGPDDAALSSWLRDKPWFSFRGRRSNEEVFRSMLAAHVVVVPTRHRFTEGMPFTLTEALASRTPVVASDHPVFTSAFTDGEGVTFFKAGDPQQLADAVQRITTSPELYKSLSRGTEAAYRKVTSATTFDALIEGWLEHLAAIRDNVAGNDPR
jgi:glycosyltransferase involved in cell wall biosynthesis